MREFYRRDVEGLFAAVRHVGIDGEDASPKTASLERAKVYPTRDLAEVERESDEVVVSLDEVVPSGRR
jgi:hypothetical protein